MFNISKYAIPNTETEFSRIVEAGTDLAKIAMNSRYSENNSQIINLGTKYNVATDINYAKANKEYNEDLYKYCLKTSPIRDIGLDVNNKADVVQMFNDDSFLKKFFAVQTAILNTINSDNEVEEAIALANVSNVTTGDSAAFEIESKSLFKVQDHSYDNNVSDEQKMFKSSIYVTPRLKAAKISMDVQQAAMLNYDFGKQIAKIAMSFRTQMYNDIIDIIYTVANVSATPFYKASFAKLTYVEVVDQLKATNSAGVKAYGTRLAFVNMSDGITSGFTTQDEVNRTGFIANLYATPYALIDQAVDSTTSSYTTQVPNNRILLLSDTGDKPVKLVREDAMRVLVSDGTQSSIYKKTYTLIDSWKAALATQAHYGIIVVG